MRVSPINNNNFTAIYKLPSDIGPNTEVFIFDNCTSDNPSLKATSSYNEGYKYKYVITKDDPEIEKNFEAAIEKDNGKYWKLPPLMNIWVNGSIAQAAFKLQKALSNGKENWVDFSSNAQDELQF